MRRSARFATQTDGYFKGRRARAFTDITGGLLQGAEYLNETGAGSKTLVIFSDMQEELDKVTVRNFPIDLRNIRVIAVNVVKLNTDNIDPRRYLGRIEAWEKRVLAAGRPGMARDQRPGAPKRDLRADVSMVRTTAQRVSAADVWITDMALPRNLCVSYSM